MIVRVPILIIGRHEDAIELIQGLKDAWSLPEFDDGEDGGRWPFAIYEMPAETAEIVKRFVEGIVRKSGY